MLHRAVVEDAPSAGVYSALLVSEFANSLVID